MKPKILLIYTGWGDQKHEDVSKRWGGVAYYRMKKMAELLSGEYDFDFYGAELGEDMKENDTTDKLFQLMSKKIPQYELVITKHIDKPFFANMISFLCQHFGVKLYVDLDDDLFHVREDQPAYKTYYPQSQSITTFGAFLSLSDGLIVSTEELKRVYAKRLKEVHNVKKPIHILPNFNDKDDWNFENGKSKDDEIVLGWAGSTTHIADLKIILTPLKKILAQNKNVKLELVGGLYTEQAKELFKDVDDELFHRISIRGGTSSWDGYPKLLMGLKWDIGLAPLIDDQFNRGKSHIKWMEYSMKKIPTIASRVYPYIQPVLGKKTIQQGKTGFLS